MVNARQRGVNMPGPWIYKPGRLVRGGFRLIRRAAPRSCMWVARCRCGRETRINPGKANVRCAACARERQIASRIPRKCRHAACGTTDPARFQESKATECSRCARRRTRNGLCACGAILRGQPGGRSRRCVACGWREQPTRDQKREAAKRERVEKREAAKRERVAARPVRPKQTKRCAVVGCANRVLCGFDSRCSACRTVMLELPPVNASGPYPDAREVQPRLGDPLAGA